MNQETNLTESNFLIFAAKHYDSVFPDTIEFYEDIKRFTYLKRLFNTYAEKGELKERLIINHIVVIYNMWGLAATPMLFLKLSDHEPILKTFLLYLNRMPDVINGIGFEGKAIESNNIPTDEPLLQRLNQI